MLKNPKYDKYGDKIGNRIQKDCGNIPIFIVVMVLQCTKDMRTMHPLDFQKRDACSVLMPMHNKTSPFDRDILRNQLQYLADDAEAF